MSRIYKTPISNKMIEIGKESGKDNIIMAIETSCDETACAIVKNGREILSNIVASQIKIHQNYGGVVPEVAAREHLNSINMVIEEAYKQAKIKKENIIAYSATVGPGLVGSLLVGLNAAKTLSLIYDKPFIGVNHLNAHVCANYIDTDLQPPFMALLISGGHTQIIKVDDYEKQEIIGETIDDATGEVYDKVARLVGIPYPGGPNLDKMAKSGDKNTYILPVAKVKGEFDFSFSGLKTAVLNLSRKLLSENNGELPKEDLAASFQENITKTLFEKTLKAARKYEMKQIVLAGGVAANSEIRSKFLSLESEGFKIYAPKMALCTDNAAMVGAAAYFMEFGLNDLDIEVFSRC